MSVVITINSVCQQNPLHTHAADPFTKSLQMRRIISSAQPHEGGGFSDTHSVDGEI